MPLPNVALMHAIQQRSCVSRTQHGTRFSQVNYKLIQLRHRLRLSERQVALSARNLFRNVKFLIEA